MTEIFICPKGSVSDRSVRTLRESGVIVVQADDPSLCRFLRSGEEVTGSELLAAAMSALQLRGKFSSESGTLQREAFADACAEIVISRHPSLAGYLKKPSVKS